ncbi:chemotaxis protein CheA [Yangia mangrovi]|uniref:Chemotaxis protein CheA n=1 Tax=Alloyangia mangrovi TaxID=1779329 RepID=A0A2A3JY72_9RHOB|nr:chemotaxis protein CheA [Alloyangia mangrovi]MCT4371831.1 chemotaxis protein CheA [Alloyangia mangrovi]
MSAPEIDPLFTAEAQQLVESIEGGLLDLRARPEDRQLVDSVFRDLHTLKGTGAMFGQSAMAQFLHDFETTFEAVRDGAMAVTEPLIGLSLQACDHVVSLLAGGPEEPGRRLLLALRDHVASARDREGPAGAGDGGSRWQLEFGLSADTLVLGGHPEAILDELRALGADDIRPLLDGLPPIDALEPETCYLRWRASLPETVGEDQIRDVFLFHEDGLDLTLAGPAQPGPPAPLDEAEMVPVQALSDGGLMRVSAVRLDEMMDRVGELVIAEARLAELAARSGDAQLVAVAEEIQRLSTGMRETTMSIRMTPIGSITGRFRRLVHDLTRLLGKQIVLDFEGLDTELDKTVVELLADPLMHLIRNAADHGLEDRGTRASMGKPEQGHIRLSARYSGAEVVIALSDDGRGLNLERIRARAVERGLIPPDAELSELETRGLILEPGFSTAAEVTELSGRGVGMDVVRQTIDKLRGSIEIDSEPGHGTAVRMRLPLTLAIIDGLLVEVAGERYTLPLAAVEHIIELPEVKARDGDATRFLDIRDRLVPYLRMRRMFSSPGVAGPHQKVVVVTSGELRVGLTVDRIIGSSQTVIKQLSPLHAELKMFSGATILGDGSVALILDVPQLVAFGQALDERHVA